MRLNDYIVCCSWHQPRNAVVKIRTGEIVSSQALNRIRDSPDKDHVIHSGGLCDPCAERFMNGKGKNKEPLVEDALAHRAESGR